MKLNKLTTFFLGLSLAAAFTTAKEILKKTS